MRTLWHEMLIVPKGHCLGRRRHLIRILHCSDRRQNQGLQQALRRRRPGLVRLLTALDKQYHMAGEQRRYVSQHWDFLGPNLPTPSRLSGAYDEVPAQNRRRDCLFLHRALGHQALLLDLLQTARPQCEESEACVVDSSGYNRRDVFCVSGHH